MNEQIYLILILLFIIIVLSKFIVRLYNTNHPRTKSAIFYFRMLLGFLIAMTIYIIIEVIRGHNVLERFYGS
ncbi:MAG TPA: hypothetical protein ENG48_05235 [Candidatus Atribacteria bacterium]|nr:hypothetical protein [Candidatus Atribacteria bacterium]